MFHMLLKDREVGEAKGELYLRDNGRSVGERQGCRKCPLGGTPNCSPKATLEEYAQTHTDIHNENSGRSTSENGA